MRIIAGKYRRRKLQTNPGLTTRPITDRAKETLFELLGDSVEDQRVADIFAGTGTMGLEALSRGAAGVVFIEQDRKAIELLRQNVATLDVGDQTLCWPTDALRSSYRPKNVPHLVPFDLIFFDPPYRMIAGLKEASPLFEALARLGREDVSSRTARLILRTPEHSTFEMPSMWQQASAPLEISHMLIHFYEKS